MSALRLPLFLILLISIQACVPQGSTGRRRTTISTDLTSDENIPTATPLAETLNFIQHGITQYTSLFSTTKDFSDTLMLRGNEINSYLNNTIYSSTNLCLMARYSAINTTLVLAAVPEYFLNYTTGAREYFYRIHAEDTQTVQNICQTSGMITKILTDNAGDTIAYSFSDICPTCSYVLSSESLKLYSTGGTYNSTLNISNLHINVSGTSSSSSTSSCNNSSECLLQGFDCCLDGQCVKDGNVKNGVNTSSTDYLIASAQVLQNPTLYSNYPEFYYVCPMTTGINTPTPTPTADPQAEAQKLLIHLGELNDCITPGEDELAICTIKYENASQTIGTSGGSFSTALDDRNFQSINPSMPSSSIVKIEYGGRILYETNESNYSEEIKSLDRDISRFTIPEPIKESTSFTAPASTGLDGKYFMLYSKNGAYYVWYNVDSSATVAPGAPAIQVNIYSIDTSSDVARKTAIAIGATTDFSASYSGSKVYVTHTTNGAGNVTDLTEVNSGITNINVYTQGDDLDGKFFSFTGNSADYFVWYSVDGSGTPAPAGSGTGIKVNILSSDNTTSIASKTASAIDAYGDFSCTSNSASVIITNSTVGVETNITDNDAGIFDIVTLTYTNGPFIDSNDNFTQAQSLTIRTQNNSADNEDTIKIKYKIDGSCERVNSALIRCTKYYVHGQVSATNPQVSDHTLTSTTYSLPSFANTALQIVTEVDGTTIPRDDSGATTWRLSGTDVIFDGKTIYNGQKVAIKYYVTDSNYVDKLMISKEAAQTEIKSYCDCADLNCSLSPKTEIINGVETIVEYSCVYPTPNLPAPLMQQTVYVSSKSAPHRFYATDGGVHDNEYSTYTQEGNLFKYTDNNYLKPNNQDAYKGFNEIYGSFNAGGSSAQPAVKVDIVKSRTYDIFVDTGNFSSCTTCGYDYYTGIQKIFPSNFLDHGGGWIPDMVETSKLNNQSDYRADDIIFGRACFVPTTMIPWTHRADNDLQTQRLNRLQAQHFLFANGYQRDWYGFDYGSLIGSFDGVTWFSIGNQRRITAKGNKLFLAVNAYYGDVTVSSSFTVTVNEVSLLSGGSTVEHDLDSDGAECQQAHLCTTDKDCITQLGYDYVCENVSNIKTPWPIFNDNAEEISGASEIKSLATMVGGTNGHSKRCVYRGRGTPCHRNYSGEDETTSYSGTANYSLHSCSSNNYCEALSTSGKFNDRITRYAKSPLNQNVSSDIPTQTDIFGLATRILGRPMEFNGSKSANIATFDSSNLITHFQGNNVDAICIPGKNTDLTSTNTLETLNSSSPSSSNEYGDVINNIGPTRTETTITDSGYYSQCSVLNDDGNLYRNKTNTIPYTLGTDEVKWRAATQNLTSNLIAMLDPNNDMMIFAPVESGIITEKGIMENICLRAPGSPCHTDFECAPSDFIASRMASLTPADISASSQELEFWQEGLVCGNSKSKYNVAEYELKNNVCCRETGEDLTIYSDQTNDSYGGSTKIIDTSNIAGLDLSIGNTTRYSRISTVYADMKRDPSTYPALKTFKINPAAPAGNSISQYQYNTFHEIASRTCCSQNWVRNFSEENGGGHRWEQGKLQEFDKGNFRCLNWLQNTGTQDANWTCSPTEADGVDCRMRYFLDSEKNGYLKFFGSLELTGIPQVAIEENTDYTQCQVDPNDQGVVGVAPVPGTLAVAATPEYNDGSNDFFSAADDNNFDDSFGLKKIFSEEKVSCCLPAGEYHGTNITSDQCCTGFASGDHPGYCCLQDYTDVTVYLNRYVSSEAGENLSASSFDPDTGYLTSKYLTAQIALQKGLCCSNKVASGRAIVNLQIPGTIDDDHKTVHFVSSDATYNNLANDKYPASSFDAGVRWNDHVYCVPAGFDGTLAD